MYCINMYLYSEYLHTYTTGQQIYIKLKHNFTVMLEREHNLTPKRQHPITVNHVTCVHCVQAANAARVFSQISIQENQQLKHIYSKFCMGHNNLQKTLNRMKRKLLFFNIIIVLFKDFCIRKFFALLALRAIINQVFPANN